jgi:hypothetical protein
MLILLDLVVYRAGENVSELQNAYVSRGVLISNYTLFLPCSLSVELPTNH